MEEIWGVCFLLLNQKKRGDDKSPFYSISSFIVFICVENRENKKVVFKSIQNDFIHCLVAPIHTRGGEVWREFKREGGNAPLRNEKNYIGLY